MLTSVAKKKRTGLATNMGRFRFSFNFRFFKRVRVAVVNRTTAMPIEREDQQDVVMVKFSASEPASPISGVMTHRSRVFR